MLAASVYAVKWLFVKKTSHIVLCRNLFHNFHRKLVLVGCDVDRRVDRRKFVLRGRDFVVLRLCENAEFPKFLVKLFHIFDHAWLDCAEIVVGKFLSFGRTRAEQGATRVEQILSFFVHSGVDEEVFLFRTYRNVYALGLFAENGKKPRALSVDCFHRAQKRRLFVQSVAVVRAERRRNAEYTVLYERVGSWVPSGVASCLEGRAQSAAGEGTRVGFAFYQLFAAKFHNYAAVFGGGDEGIVLFCRYSRERLKPVSEVGHAFFDCPVFHFVCDDVCRFS